MTEPTESPSGKPWLLALGVGLLAGAVGWLWWSRRDCGCEHEEGTEGAPGATREQRAFSMAWSKLHPDQVAAASAEPVVDPLSWDSHTENAWGVAFGGERKLEEFRAPVDELAEFEAELGGEG